MKRNLHNFSPGQTAVMFGLRAHTEVRENEMVEQNERPSRFLSSQIEKIPARLKPGWRPRLSLRWRFAQK